MNVKINIHPLEKLVNAYKTPSTYWGTAVDLVLVLWAPRPHATSMVPENSRPG